MIINSVKLHNIRSYADEVIEFPEGTVLLSGDIGCGKSSVLLAIEFALFGIMRGGLSGTSLLRHGKNEGSVELNMTLEGKDVTIYRSLKRGKEYVNQDTGYIITDGEKFEGTPVELKAKIIEMIGYPSELVSKSKSLIFRYTVYTPQEEMKAILLEGDESRLDTLRKIFNIDKYKRIKENAALLAREMRSNRKVLESRIDDFEDVKEKLKEKKERMSELSDKKKALQEELEEQEEHVEKAKERVKEVEEESEDYRNKKQELELRKSKYKDKKNQWERNKEEYQELKKIIDELEEELDGTEAELAEEIEEGITVLEKDIKKKEEVINNNREQIAEHKALVKQATQTKEKISGLDKCPLCEQKVDDQHVKDVKEKKEEEINKAEKQIEELENTNEELREVVEESKNKLKELREREKDMAAVKERLKTLKEKKERMKKLLQEVKSLKEELKEMASSIKQLSKELKEGEDVSEQLEKAKESYEEKKDELNELKVKKARLDKEAEALNDVMSDLKKRIDEMKEYESKLKKVKESLEWLDEYFVNVIDSMEKQVMLRIYSEFNEYFVEWFNVLMEDETLNVRLDEKFAPVIVQDGYETTIEDLSGGERTSVALAYRLSLNKVINDFIGTIKTKDLIILDEPTDGFSSEQLDKVREVLDELDIKQIIIVSHEAKMESFVHNVIRIAKQNHVSTVVT